jgi:uracil-DNA glycosylase
VRRWRREDRKIGKIMALLEEPLLPRSLADPIEIEARKQLLHMPKASPLRAFAAALRRSGEGEVPDFDPLDGGINARALFLFEKPGPMTDPTRGGERQGSGFISRDNNDDTAEAIFRFMRAAGLARQEVIIWNTIPRWNGTRRITADEVRSASRDLDGLLDLLPRLSVVVLVGKRAQFTHSFITKRSPGLPILYSAHPSPIVRTTRRLLWESIPDDWAKVGAHL